MPRKLTKEEKECVRKWLKNKYQDQTCPFPFGALGNGQCREICAKKFPKILGHLQCPCHAYPLKYVISEAKKMIEDHINSPSRKQGRGDEKEGIDGI